MDVKETFDLGIYLMESLKEEITIILRTKDK